MGNVDIYAVVYCGYYAENKDTAKNELDADVTLFTSYEDAFEFRTELYRKFIDGFKDYKIYSAYDYDNCETSIRTEDDKNLILIKIIKLV